MHTLKRCPTESPPVSAFRPPPGVYPLALLQGREGRYGLRITWLSNGIEQSATLQTLGTAGGGGAGDGPNLLAGEYALGYAEGVLPGFRYAGSLESLALLHASCRKPHGQGPEPRRFGSILSVDG